MRLIYLDEAGTSKPSEEPFLIVAGVIINADQDWTSLQRYLRSLVRLNMGHLPADARDNFIFHAKDIFHGRNKDYPEELWDRPKRMGLLRTAVEKSATEAAG